MATRTGPDWRKSRAVTHTLLAFLVVAALEGPLRLLLSQAGLVIALYVRDLLLLSIVVAALRYLRPPPLALHLALFLVLFSAVAVLYVRNPVQIGFGLKVFLPLFAGVLASRAFFQDAEWLRKPLLLLLFISAGGVLLNFFVPFPWEDLWYSVGAVEVEATRAWMNTGGIKRLAGFARSSTDAASQILVLAAFLMAFSHRRWLPAVAWLVAGVAILMTTSKATIVAFMLLTMALLARRSLGNRLWALGLVPLALVVVLAPVLVAVVDYQWTVDDPVLRIAFASLEARIEWVWTAGFDLVARHGSVIMGRGVGGIGTAQKYFESEIYHPGDNLFLYMYGMFGLFSLLALGAVVARTRFLEPRRDRRDMFALLILITTLGYGITSGVFEGSVLSLFLGLAVGHVWARARTARGTGAGSGVGRNGRRPVEDRLAGSVTIQSRP